jgi:hypothetical protein
LEGELLNDSVEVQLDTLVTEQEAFISTSLLEVLRRPASNTVKSFVHRWGLENARATEVLFSYLWANPSPLDDDVFDRLVLHALSEGEGHQTIAFMALSVCEPERFGQKLLSEGWRALPSANERLQVFGSKAIFAASKNKALEGVADVVAPWCLLEEAVKRGGGFKDLELAVQTVSRALQGANMSAFPEIAKVSISSDDVGVVVEVKPSDEALQIEALRGEGPNLFDPDVRWARHESVRQEGQAYLQEVKSAGAVMATRLVTMDVARKLVSGCASTVSTWLDGLEETPTSAFISRMNLAGGLFLALCEALLEADDARGALLWHALRKHLRFQFVDVGELDVLLLMLFRLPESPVVLQLRKHHYCLSQNMTDESYLDLVLAAVSQGALPWLEAAISADEDAKEPFRRKRAITLRGYIPPEIGYRQKWREGELIGTWDAARLRAQQTRNEASQARYWWQKFLTAPDQLSAFCSWQIFVKCADKMAWVWMQTDIDRYEMNDELWRLKMLHVRLNRSSLKSAIEEKSSKGASSRNRHLIGCDSPYTWFTPESLAVLGY